MKTKLKYLFSCEINDEIYRQNPEDVSITDKTKSCYYDIMDKKVARFWLAGKGHIYLVDLKDGHFEVDGISFRLHDENLKDFKLIFYRTHTIDFAGLVEVNHDVEYCFGWEAKKDGKDYKQIIRIK